MNEKPQLVLVDSKVPLRLLQVIEVKKCLLIKEEKALLGVKELVFPEVHFISIKIRFIPMTRSLRIGLLLFMQSLRMNLEYCQCFSLTISLMQIFDS